MNSSAFSCGVIPDDTHSVGNVVPRSLVDTWMSLKTNRPH
jgi:hypothetical protein